MIRFMLVYLSVYGGINIYCFWKLSQTFRLSLPGQVAFGLMVALMVLGPILVRQLEHANYVHLAHPMALVSYAWMFVIFWLTGLLLLMDIWNLGVRALGWAGAPGALARLALPLRPTMGVYGVILVAGTVWGLVEARGLTLERLTFESPHLPPGSKGFKVLQISDVHLGLLERERRLGQILRVVEETRPDLIVSTGDLVDRTAFHMEHLAEMLARVKPPLGKYAVFGNHEYYVGVKPSLQFYEQAGFKVLREESARIGKTLLLVGADDPAGHLVGENPYLGEDKLLPGGRNGSMVLYLKHRPLAGENTLGRFDLQLSGHTHNGQIFPFGLLVRTQFPFMKGFHALAKGSALYVSRGSGTWGAPMRVGSPPEVTLIDIVPARQR